MQANKPQNENKCFVKETFIDKIRQNNLAQAQLQTALTAES